MREHRGDAPVRVKSGFGFHPQSGQYTFPKGLEHHWLVASGCHCPSNWGIAARNRHSSTVVGVDVVKGAAVRQVWHRVSAVVVKLKVVL